MKILYITPTGPSLRNGGGRHCYANARALCLYPGAVVDYIGPEIDDNLHDLSEESFRISLARPFTLIDKVKAAMNGASTSLVSLFSEFVKRHDITKYDMIFVEYTRCGFVFQICGGNVQTICSVHNVESDYLTLNGTGSTKLAVRNIQQSEKITLDSCRNFLVMHNEDMQRLCEIYPVDKEAIRFLMHPVCSLRPKLGPLPYTERERVLIFAGSLNTKFNESGLLEFLLRCWPALKDAGYLLVVAGSNPSRELSNYLLSQPRVRLIVNPPDMEPLLRNARMLLLPDLTGTGMKLRVAEALSLGVPVLGTRAGLRGYKDISKYGRAVDTIDDMQHAFFEMLEDPSLLPTFAKTARQRWQESYSLEVFTERLHGILDTFQMK